MNLGAGLAAAKAELMAALDEAEKASGGSLSADNDKGWQVSRPLCGGRGWRLAGVATPQHTHSTHPGAACQPARLT